jgi:hypothetical protein
MKVDRKSESAPRRKGPLSARARSGSDPKLTASTSCPKCGVTYHEGRWTWQPAPAGAVRRKCPACQQIEDREAGGFVTIGGPFFTQHRDEVLGVVRSREKRQMADHPLERIIAIEPEAEGVVVSTTDPHLAKAVAHALHEAFKGEVDMGKAELPVRARWSR